MISLVTEIDDPLFAGVDEPAFELDESGELVDLTYPFRGAAGYGRWKRYRRPHPITGKIDEYPRCSSIAKLVQSTFALDRWQRGRLIKGLAARPDLIELAQGIEMDSTAALEAIADRALEFSGAHVKADKGTALHKFAEIVDSGGQLPKEISKANRADVNAYRAEVELKRLDVRLDLMERVVWVEEINVMGRLDRIYVINTLDGRTFYVVGDLKTSQHDPLKYSATSVAVQLAIYSRASHFETAFGSGEWEAPPVPVNQDVGLIAHFSSGSAKAEIFEVNLNLGWELAQTAMRLRELNSAKGRAQLIRPYSPERW
jgi:hypothetical protein